MSIASFDPHDGDSNQKSKSLAPRKEQISAFGWTTRQTLSRGCISSSNSDVSSKKNEAVSRLVLHSLLSEKLVQLQKCTGLRPSEQHVARIVVAITNCAGELLAVTEPCDRTQAQLMIDQLKFSGDLDNIHYLPDPQ